MNANDAPKSAPVQAYGKTFDALQAMLEGEGNTVDSRLEPGDTLIRQQRQKAGIDITEAQEGLRSPFSGCVAVLSGAAGGKVQFFETTVDAPRGLERIEPWHIAGPSQDALTAGVTLADSLTEGDTAQIYPNLCRVLSKDPARAAKTVQALGFDILGSGPFPPASGGPVFAVNFGISRGEKG
jgi:hypothetical protein